MSGNHLAPDAVRALAGLRASIAKMNAFIAENEDPDGEPKCGYSQWYERMADFREDIDWSAQQLAAALADVDTSDVG